MQKQKNRKLLFCLVACAAILIVAVAALGAGRIKARAAAAEPPAETQNVREENSLYGVYTSLSLSIDGGNGQIYAMAKNDVTIFPAKVKVYVQLYYSYEYKDSYEDMELAVQEYTDDLNMGKTITATASTGGEQKYWKARMYYKVDKKDWKEKVTNTYLFAANGLMVA